MSQLSLSRAGTGAMAASLVRGRTTACAREGEAYTWHAHSHDRASLARYSGNASFGTHRGPRYIERRDGGIPVGAPRHGRAPIGLCRAISPSSSTDCDASMLKSPKNGCDLRTSAVMKLTGNTTTGQLGLSVAAAVACRTPSLWASKPEGGNWFKTIGWSS